MRRRRRHHLQVTTFPFMAVLLCAMGSLIFLLLVQLSEAVGAGGAINPIAAAWIPNVVFLVLAAVLLKRVRT